MATSYTFNFTDILKTGFVVSPYTTNGTLSPSDGTLLSTSVAAATSLKLYGKGMQEYGEGIEQNLIYMLENFANSTEPTHAIEGQLWYATAAGSPQSTELAIYNGSNFDTKILLNTGTSAMSDNLDIGGNNIINLADAVNATDALNRQTGDVRYINVVGDTMTGNLLLSSTGSPSTPLTPSEPAHAINKQYADDTYVNISGDTMTGALILHGSVGAGSPVDILEAASIEYVNNAVGASANYYLSAITYQAFTGAPVPVAGDKEILFTIDGQPDIAIGGISFAGEDKPATEITTTATGDIPSGHAQNAINLLESKKLDIDGSDSMTGNLNLDDNYIINLLDPINPQDSATKAYVDFATGLTAPAISITTRNISLTDGTDTFPIFSHGAGYNKLQVSLNGQLQYNNSLGASNIVYDIRAGEILAITPTTLDPNTVYSFDITVDGGGSPITPVTVEINTGSPLTPISTHQELINAINTQLFDISGLYPRMSLTGINNSETITSSTLGLPSAILIEPPSSGSGTYLFDIPASITVTAVTIGTASPAVLDTLTVVGDQTASFPIGKKFTLRDTTTDGTSGTYLDNYDGVFTVSNSTLSGSPEVTIVELTEAIDLNGTTITGFGNIYLTNLSGLASINQVNGVDYDYAELLSLDGTDIRAGYAETTTFIKFNTTPPSGELLEILLLP